MSGWAIARSRPQREILLARQIERLGLESYRPIEVYYVTVSRHKNGVKSPRYHNIAPGLVFFWVERFHNLDIVRDLFECEGVVLGGDSRPYLIPLRQMNPFIAAIDRRNREAAKIFDMPPKPTKAKWVKLGGDEVAAEMKAYIEKRGS
jgi:hypothetical protein